MRLNATRGYIHKSVYYAARQHQGTFHAHEVYDYLVEHENAPYTLDQVRRALYALAERRSSDFVKVRRATYRWQGQPDE